MNMNFKPNTLKIILGIAISIITNFIYWTTQFSCEGAPCPYFSASHLSFVFDFMFDALGLLYLIVIFIVIYIIWSLFQKK